MPIEKMPHWREERRHRIVAAATRLFGAAPYGDVQMIDIARAAGVGKPTLYRYFASKEELFLAVLDAAFHDIETRLAAVAAAAPTPAEALRRMLGLLVEMLAQHLNSLRLLGDESPGLAESWRRVYRDRRQPILGALRRTIDAGIAAGQFRPVDTAIAPALMIGMVRAGINASGHASREQIATAVADFALAGLALPQVERSPLHRAAV